MCVMDRTDAEIARSTAIPTLDDDPALEQRVRHDAAAYGDTERLWEPDNGPAGTAEAFDGLQPLGEEPVSSVAQVAGHPLHPMIVPLPIGAFVGAFLADLAYVRTQDKFWARAAHVLSGAAVGTGLLAGALGATDFVGREQIRSRGSAWIHGGGNLAAVGLGLASVALRRDRHPDVVVPRGLALTTTIVGILAVTGWIGGELTFRHRIGAPEA
jgi:uncharacterized membrane protein